MKINCLPQLESSLSNGTLKQKERKSQTQKPMFSMVISMAGVNGYSMELEMNHPGDTEECFMVMEMFHKSLLWFM